MNLLEELKQSVTRSLRMSWLFMKWFLFLMGVLVAADLAWRALR